MALSSGRPPAAIGIVRVSGPAAFDLAQAIGGVLPPPQRASLRVLRDAEGGILDQALVLRFDAGASATGEDLVEFHCHGGRAVVAAVQQALLVEGFSRPALPGEFTRRALANGRIDLAQARGLADLLEAETETQRRYAVMASEGHLSRLIGEWLDRLGSMAAEVEASIDYSDEGDVVAQETGLAGVVERAELLSAEIADVLAAPPIERWRDGIRVVLAGPPNSGKSTLLNLLAGRDAAIASPVPGTTRDRLEVAVQREGVGYLLTDTAGLRAGVDDPIERIGIERAERAAATADLVLWLGDDTPPYDVAVHVHSRADQPGRLLPPPDSIPTSALDSASIDRLWSIIAARTAISGVETIALHAEERARCFECQDALVAINTTNEAVLVAENLRAAATALGAILGQNATEAVLDRLFARFCVGK